MSRSTTSSGTAPKTNAAQGNSPVQSPAAPGNVPMEKVAMLAYQKWIKSGCKHGCDKQHWFEAEAEVKAEMMKRK